MKPQFLIPESGLHLGRQAGNGNRGELGDRFIVVQPEVITSGRIVEDGFSS
ncbi:MAG: hypothetical protein HRU20_23565 [Pseudomonadales bacterium]|nr:hypothetical protein [Pseudomonadales bacterium]